MTRKFTIYSDGASFNNGHKKQDLPMYGSFCSLIIENNNLVYKTFKINEVTNNQMELLGCLHSLIEIYNNRESLDDHYIIDVYSDSQYLVNGINKFLKKWKKQNWIGFDKQPIRNKDLWKLLDYVVNICNENTDINFFWIKGHKGKKITKEEDIHSYYNEQCDSLAVECIKNEEIFEYSDIMKEEILRIKNYVRRMNL